MTHEQDQRDHFSTAIAQTSTLITTLEAEPRCPGQSRGHRVAGRAQGRSRSDIRRG